MLSLNLLAVALVGAASSVLATPALVNRAVTPVNKPSIPAGPGKTYFYRGCYDELKGGKNALNHDITSSLPSVTLESCVAGCAAKNYKLAGVMNGKTCACDNAISSKAPKLDDKECSLPCTGNAGEICGGVWHYSTYYTNKSTPLPVPTSPATVGKGPDSYVHLGCFVDRVQYRTLGGASFSSANMTPTACTKFCRDQKYRLAGVEHGNECWCGVHLVSPELASPVLSTSSDCAQACSGDSTSVCGDDDRINVYGAVDDPNVLDPAILVGTNLLNQYLSVGCYSDSYEKRLLDGYSFEADDMTATKCAVNCFSKDYKYAGLELGKQCFCGNTVDDSQEVDGSKCDTPCAGDRAHSCGGGLRVDLYKSLLLSIF